MTKREFLEVLGKALPPAERQERLLFYSEMIDDRVEEGMSEEEAVAQIGDISAILADAKPAKQKRKYKVWEIVLLAVGSPIWVSLLIAAVAIVFSLYVSLWAIVVALWAVFAALVGCAPGCTIGGCALMGVNAASGLALIAAAMVCAGLAILLFYACKAATGAMVKLTVWAVHRRAKKEGAQ